MLDREATLIWRWGSLATRSAAVAVMVAFAQVNLAVNVAYGQTVRQNPTPSHDVGNAVRSDSFDPGLDDVMTMLVQPRHIKLYYAGSRHNWELAAFELQELRSAFQRAMQTVPKYLDNDLEAALQAFMEPRFQTINAAISAGNGNRFNAAYAQLTEGCNACHAFLEHPFIVIKVPDAAVSATDSDQRFNKQ